MNGTLHAQQPHRPTRTRIKICGLTREEDVDAAVAFGADAVGFVLYPGSKRCVSPARAAELGKRGCRRSSPPCCCSSTRMLPK